MKLFPIHINVMELGNETSEEYLKPFTQNWLILLHLFLSFQLKRYYNQSIEHSDPINFNSEYDRNMNKKDEMISENQGPSETHSEKDEKDIDSKIDSTLISTENKYWEPVGSQLNFFNFPKSCLHLCLLNFKLLSHFAKR
jgi:hypothetical protein